MNAGLTQVLADSTNTYLYGNGRISQHTTQTEYFLGDALGSVRQLADTAGAVTLTQSYSPYGETISSVGSGNSTYQFTGEARDANGLTYLRARYYNSGDGRFISRDTWNGDYNRPLSLNRWNYVEGNPVNLVDPSGMISCEKTNDPMCLNNIKMLRRRGIEIRNTVSAGYVPPVESFAQYVDYAFYLFDNNIRGAMWALTLTLDGMDANAGVVWAQAGVPHRTYWLNSNWLPYKNNQEYNNYDWDDNGVRGGKGDTWIHSQRGDWNVKYWDKTANQAFHFWYFVAVTFFDRGDWATTANIVHESGRWENLSLLEDDDAPSKRGKTKEDWDLSNAGMILGERLYGDYSISILDECYSHMFDYYIHTNTKPGAWIRANLK